jgi:hypothetical protein
MTKALQAPPPQTNERDRASNATLKAIITMVIEMIPGGLGPWGIGDVVTAIEAIAGRTVDGLRLSVNERMIYLGASAIPLVPARPILALYRWMTNPQR